MVFNLKPFLRQKLNTPNDWCFQYVPYGSVRKSQVKARLKSIYPTLKIDDIHVIKSLKRVLVIVKSDKPSPWSAS